MAKGRPQCAWIALAHGLRHHGTFCSVCDRFLDHSAAAGSTDLLLILLVVHHADPVSAALAALAGSILGGYLTWKAGAKGEKRLSIVIFPSDLLDA